MFIKSPYRDYYDGCKATDQEREPLFLRYPKVIEEYNVSRWFGRFQPHLIIDYDYVGFCGTYHIAYRLSAFDIKYKEVAVETCYTLEHIDRFVEKHFKQIVQDHWYGHGGDNWRRNRQLGWNMPTRRSLENDIERRNQPLHPDDQEQQRRRLLLFETHRTPIITTAYKNGKRITTINDRLQNFEFYKVFPPQQAYQQIRMWLSNLASPEKPIPKIDDQLLAEAKGFDQFSFRKPKNKKKK